MSNMNIVDEIQEEVLKRADELTPELLPALLEKLSSRNGLVMCRKHTKYLLPYINAQIMLTRAKRNDFHLGTIESGRTLFYWRGVRDARRRLYRLIECTCWVPKR